MRWLYDCYLTETANNQKLMLEYEKYQELQTRNMRMQEDYERQLAEQEERSNKALQELEEHYNKYVKATISI